MPMNCLSSLINGLIVSNSTFEMESKLNSTRVQIWDSSPMINGLVQDVVSFYSLESKAGPYYTPFESKYHGITIIVYENQL